MKLLVALAFTTTILVVAMPGSAADGPYVPLGAHGDVTLTSTFAPYFPLTLQTPQNGYGALQTKDYQGVTRSTISNNGELWIRPDANYPRILIQSAGYEGPDSFVEQIGGSPVMTIAAGGEVESYNYYVHADDPRLSVRNRDDSLAGGIDALGRFTTEAHSAPNPADMANGEARIWFDPTPGTGGLMVTDKDSAGNVKTVKIG